MKSLKINFNVRTTSNSNLITNKNSKNNKIILPKKESMYDKINNHFKSYDFAKLQLLGEDNMNYGDFIFHGYVYKPKNIKVEYLGHKKIKSDLKIRNNLYKNGHLYLKRKNISFINPINNMEPNNNMKMLDNKINFSILDDLPIIPRINNSNLEGNKNDNNKNNINNNDNLYKNDNTRIKIYNLKKLNISANYSKKKELERNKNESSHMNNNNNKKQNIWPNNLNNKSHFNISPKYILNNIKMFKLKNQLKKKIDLLENQVNNSSKFISNGSKINEDEKPQFKLRFKNLKYNFKKYLD